MTPVTMFTVATAVFAELHANTRPDRVLPPASRATAVAFVVVPTVMDGEANETAIVAIGAGVTATPTDALSSLTDAVITAVPTLNPVTTPPALTEATVAGNADHATTPVAIDAPF
ncbi:MAG: hypothetical protein IPP90_14095 [Gemmatimonadaceae bacterium]|nr:hypothetical protein [Gemmatimonadaceae bacterium]